MNYNLVGKRIWISGHKGMVGSAVMRRLYNEDCEIITVGKNRLDLLNQQAVKEWILKEKPDAIILASAKVGGIEANNSYPVDFLYENLMIEANIIHAANLADVERVLFLGSSCIYPKFSKQPIAEENLLNGQLEPTNEWYSIAKIVGVKLIQAYRKQYNRNWISAMPTNLYGPGDNYNLKTSHVLPALIRKFHEAKVLNQDEVTIWGDGSPLREFMHCDDLADALIFLIQNYSEYDPINVGTGQEVSIRDLAKIIVDVVGYNPSIKWDTTKPNGAPRKLLDSSRLYNMGWSNIQNLKDGISSTYEEWKKMNKENINE